jgi:SMODS and SLOG-associating 2TM effector domain 3/SMODS and SLOG-associating 2TM effector domain 1
LFLVRQRRLRSRREDDVVTTRLPVLASDDFPALHGSANQQSTRAQRSFLRWSTIRLGGILLAAVGGAIGWTTGRLHVGGAIAVVAFAAALAAELLMAVQRPDRIWYEGRTAAESAKTLTWRYMMRGESFESHVVDADARFLAQLKDVLRDLDALPVHVLSGSERQISVKMRDVRALPFEERRSVYLSQRIQDQEGWYAKKAAWNAKRANFWIVSTVALEFLGLIGGVIKAVSDVNVDLLGVFAAAAAGATAWLQAKQHQNLATAYGVASQELAMVADELEAADESTWARFVTEAEEAISQEHTLWRSSRGERPRRRAAN